MKISIRPMEKKDNNDCFDLENKCFGYKVRFDKSLLYDRLNNLREYGMCFVAINRKIIVGHVTSFYTRTGDIYIDFICVSRKHERKGIGRLLMNKIKSENPRANIYLRTGSNNQNSIKFYLSMGFEIHEVKGDDWLYRDILMVLKRR